jgi:hypothetical protein
MEMGITMTKGVEIRAQIDTESVKALLLVNGGGAVALLAFLPSVFSTTDLRPLAEPVTWALFAYQLGLFFAVLHNHWRRRCSLAYEAAVGKPPPCTVLGRALSEPCVCHRSWACMWLSALAFLVAGLIVFCGLLHITT